jgi:hypothetical protein
MGCRFGVSPDANKCILPINKNIKMKMDLSFGIILNRIFLKIVAVNFTRFEFTKYYNMKIKKRQTASYIMMQHTPLCFCP